MIRQEHMFCKDCGYEGVRSYDWRNPPTCPRRCGLLRIDISRWEGQAPSTDVYGSETYFPTIDVHASSTRDKDTQMRLRGFYPAGDRIHGARTTITSSPAERRRRTTTSNGGSHERAGWKPAV